MTNNGNSEIKETAKTILSVLFIFGLSYFTILSATNHKSKLASFIAAIVITILLFVYIQKYLVRHSVKLVHKGN